MSKETAQILKISLMAILAIASIGFYYFYETSLQKPKKVTSSFDATKPKHIQKKSTPPNKPKIEIQTFDATIKRDNFTKLEKQFDASKDIALALILAEEYYHTNRYKKALKWSLIANEINSNNERSWIIFAKSYAKMGQKQRALKALRAYLELHPKSNEIKKLTINIIKGEY